MRLRPLPVTVIFASLALCLLLFSGCSETPEAKVQRIVILTNGDDPFWDPCEAGAKAAEKDLGLEAAGYRVTFERANFTVKGQLDKLKQYSLATDIVAVGISVYDATNPSIAEALKKLKKQGIKIITIDGDVDREKYRDVRYAYLGTDNVIGGRELGRATKALRPEGGGFGFFVGNKGSANAKARMAGFLEGAGSQFREVVRVDDGGQRAKARKTVRDAIEQHADINVLVGIWAYNGPAAAQIVTEKKIRAKFTLVTFDADQGSIIAMGEGNMDVMVVQNPFNMGYQGVKVLKALVDDDQKTLKEMFPNYGKKDGDLYRTGLKVIVPDEGTPLKRDLFDKETEFLKLEEFKKWLKKYNLKSS